MELKNRSIELFGTKYKIKIVETIEIDGPNGKEYPLGLTDYNNNIITIASYTDNVKVPKNEMEITLLHELTHAVLMTGQYKDECSNEPLVEWVARCLYSLLNKKVI